MTTKKRPRRGATNPPWLVERREKVGAKLAERRREAKIKTQHDLAQMTGLTTMTIGRIERGLSGSYESYRKIADALGLPPDWFVRPEEIPTAVDIGSDTSALEKALAFLTLSDEVRPMLARLIHRLLAIASEDPDRAEFIAAGILAGLPSGGAGTSERDRA